MLIYIFKVKTILCSVVVQTEMLIYNFKVKTILCNVVVQTATKMNAHPLRFGGFSIQ